MKKNIWSIIFLFVLLSSLTCYSQSFKYKNLPSSWKNSVLKSYSLTETELGSFYDATKSLPRNYVMDGSEDYTNFIQSAINKYNKVKLPNFPVLINDKSLILRSNSVIYFQPKTVLKMKTSSRGNVSTDHFNLLTIKDVNNVKIYNMKLVGDRKNHVGKKGEWGMGVSILSSSNIFIYGGKISDFWGDGIYISQSGRRNSYYGSYFLPSNNVTIKNVWIDNNRRNGISIITGDKINLEDIVASNSNGTRPMAGIDIEPNNQSELLREINMNNIYTYNNARDGVLMVMNKITRKGGNNGVSINLSNHYDDGSYSPLAIVSVPKEGAKKLAGAINITNTNWRNNSNGIRYNQNISLLPKINVKGLVFHTEPVKMLSNEKGYKNVMKIEDLNR